MDYILRLSLNKVGDYHDWGLRYRRILLLLLGREFYCQYDTEMEWQRPRQREPQVMILLLLLLLLLHPSIMPETKLSMSTSRYVVYHT